MFTGMRFVENAILSERKRDRCCSRNEDVQGCREWTVEMNKEAMTIIQSINHAAASVMSERENPNSALAYLKTEKMSSRFIWRARDIYLAPVEHWQRTSLSYYCEQRARCLRGSDTLNADDFLASAGGIFGLAYHMSDASIRIAVSSVPPHTLPHFAPKDVFRQYIVMHVHANVCTSSLMRQTCCTRGQGQAHAGIAWESV